MSNHAGLSCPSGGSFYICAGNTTEFIGCCTSNPCTDARQGECPSSDIRNSSFSASAYEDIAPQDCSSSTGLWYTCNFTNPPFLGCCSQNPCFKGSCPIDDVVPAKLSTNTSRRALFLSYASGLDSDTTTPVTPVTPVTTITATSTSSSHDKSGISTGAIIGIVVGSVCAVLVVGIFAFYVWKRKKNHRISSPPGHLHPSTATSPVSQMQQPLQSMAPSTSPGFSSGPSPPISGYAPQMQYPDDPNSVMPTPATDSHRFVQQPALAGSPYVNSQYSGGYQSVSTLSRDQSGAQYPSGISYATSGHPSPGFVPNYSQGVQELSGQGIERSPIVQSSPQEMPVGVGHQLHPAPPYKEDTATNAI